MYGTSRPIDVRLGFNGRSMSDAWATLPMAPGQWVHVRLRDAQGITAFTNPIYARGF